MNIPFDNMPPGKFEELPEDQKSGLTQMDKAAAAHLLINEFESSIADRNHHMKYGSIPSRDAAQDRYMDAKILLNSGMCTPFPIYKEKIVEVPYREPLPVMGVIIIFGVGWVLGFLVSLLF